MMSRPWDGDAIDVTAADNTTLALVEGASNQLLEALKRMPNHTLSLWDGGTDVPILESAKRTLDLLAADFHDRQERAAR